MAWPRLYASRPPDSWRDTTRSWESSRYAAAYDAAEVSAGSVALSRTRRTHAATEPVPSASTSHCAASEAYARRLGMCGVTSGATVRANAAIPTVVTTEPKPHSSPASRAGASRYGSPIGSSAAR